VSTPTTPLVLVPLDGSELAERVMPAAAEIARRVGARLLLVSVPEVFGLDVAWYISGPVEGPELAPIPQLVGEARDDTGRMLERHAAWLRAQGLDVATDVLEDVPADAILEAARAHGAWLVLISTHGRGGVTRWAYGSVADKVIHHATSPVLVVRAAAERVPAAFDHIFVALDGSPAAEAVLDRVGVLARAFDARVTLAHVVEDPPPSAFTDALLEARQRHVERMRAYLDRLGEPLRAAGLRVDAEILGGEDVAEALLARDDDPDIDLVALTTHGRGGLSRWAVGSVADRVLRSANTPVLVQRVGGAP